MASSALTTGRPRAPRVRRGRDRRWTPRTTVLVIVGVVIALITIFPLVYMVTSSFKTAEDVNGTALLPPNPTLDNFAYVFTEVPFLRYLFNSFFVSAVVTVVALFFHSMAAYALARLKFKGRETVFLIIFSTLLVSAPVILIPSFVVVRTLGMLDSYAGLIIPSIFSAFGIFLLRQFYLGLPNELEEAALVDGASYWRIYWSVVLPLSRPILAALSVFFFLANWNAFVWPLTITSNPDLRVVQVGISTFQQQYASDWNYVLAASTVAALPTLLLFFFFQKQIVESIKTSGFK
ncbi:multiple sugar transport system permease protein [Diaminobutyricimonas aerilata]|uniref:Multiple sugar transport system permease protein n=1 Tax=Diaminobutyricimonas aerilata TaxID=1162967 RepID=A0A2M9CHK3_9MICO|nr:carbohydrate ABC transporter permease [Diaminobutyricimonas aerilata]PJJ71367.1 multiple sugar transport system permease protein [Diaminobutyricimonas aerilata]